MGLNMSKHAEAIDDAVEGAAKATAADFGATLDATSDRVAGKVDDIGASAREALQDMQRIVGDFATRTGQRVGDVADVARSSGTDAVERFGALARDVGRGGLDQVADVVAKRPVAALAIAAGVGLVLGMATRPGSRK